jgi:hypothetical protein
MKDNKDKNETLEFLDVEYDVAVGETAFKMT